MKEKRSVLSPLGACIALAAALSFAPFAQAAPRHAKTPATGGDAPAEKKDNDKLEYETPFPTKMNWSLRDLNGKSPPSEATLTIDENLRGSGTSGCNTWSAALYPIKGHRLAMGPVAQTKKTCAADVTQFEHLYLSILHSGPTWEQTGSTLTVKSQAGTLVFNRGL